MDNNFSEGSAMFDRAAGLYSRCESCEEGADYFECARLFEEAGETLEKEGAPVRQCAMAYNRAGMCRFRGGVFGSIKTVKKDDDEARDFERARELMKQLPEHNSDPLMAVIRSNLAEYFQRNGENEEAAKLYRQSAVTLSDLMYAELRAGSPGSAFDQYIGVLKSLAELYRGMEEYIQAETCFTRAINLIEENGPEGKEKSSQLAGFYNARGTVRFKNENYIGEVSDCTRAIELCTLSDSDPLELAIMFCNRGEAYQLLEKYEEMIVDMRQALGELEKCEPSFEAAEMRFRASYGLARGLELSGRGLAAANAYLAAAQMSRDMSKGMPPAVAKQRLRAEAACRVSRAVCLESCPKHLYYESMKEYNRAAEILEGLKGEQGVAARLSELYIKRGELYEAFDELEEAKRDFLRADELSDIT